MNKNKSSIDSGSNMSSYRGFDQNTIFDKDPFKDFTNQKLKEMTQK